MSRTSVMMQADMKNISRDALSLVILMIPLIIFSFLRWGVPLVRGVCLQWFDLSDYYMLIYALFFLMIPYMSGILAGFLFLDERDQHILEVIAVTPLQRRGHLWHRSLLMMGVAVVFCVGLFPWVGLVQIDWTRQVLVSLAVSLEVPLFALLLLALAGNKVEGLALSKFLGLVSFAPIVAYFLPGAWKFTMAWSPPFWMVQAYMADSAVSFWVLLGVGLVYHVVLVGVLVKRMEAMQG